MRERPLFYYLDKNHNPVPIRGVGLGATLAWAEHMGPTEEEFARKSVVGRTAWNGIVISTVFLGIDHAFGAGKPVLFETMIFNHANNEFQRRYHTWAEAESGHMEAVELVQKHVEQLNSLTEEQAKGEIARIMERARG